VPVHTSKVAQTETHSVHPTLPGVGTPDADMSYYLNMYSSDIFAIIFILECLE
jgi:hypothetical protein